MYRNTTEAFNDILSGPSRHFYCKLSRENEEITTGFRDVKITLQANSETEKPSIGGTVAVVAEITLEKPRVMITGKEYQLSFGLKVNDKIEWCPMGMFTPEKPKEDDGFLKFTAYDRMYTGLNLPYFTDIQNYPVNAKQILEEISRKSGIPIAGISALPDGIKVDRRNNKDPNTGESYLEKPFEGFTYREALGYLAQFYGKFATVDRVGGVELRWYTETGYVVETNRSMGDIVSNEQSYEIQQITCTVGEKTITSGSGVTGMSLENPVMTQVLLDGVYQRIGGMKYLPTTVSFLGDCRLDLGDLVTVVNRKGEKIKVPVMSLTYEFDGGLSTSVGSYGTTEAEESTAQKGPTAQKIDRIYTDLFLVKEVLANKVTADYLEANYATIGQLDAVDARISNLTADFVTTDYLTANYATIDSLNTKFATIDFANVNIADIEKGFVKELLVSQGLLADRVVSPTVTVTDCLTGVKIVANDIVAGKLDAATIEVTNLNAANITVGTINGQQIAPGAIDLSKLSESLSGTIVQTEADVLESLKQAGLAADKAGSASSTANAALSTANTAKSAASTAQATADGKNAVFYQASAPGAAGRKLNDAWFDTNDANRMYYWSGSAWVAKQFGTNAIANAAVTNALIANAAVDNAKIANLDAGKITTGILSAARIGTGSLSIGKLDTSLQDYLTYTRLMAVAFASGKLVYKDGNFAKGANSVSVYNNANNGAVTVTRTAKPADCPNQSGYCIQIRHTAAGAPGYGGFVQSIQSRAGAHFLIKYIIKLPPGYKLAAATNSMGTGYIDRWLTDTAGTGDYTEYVREVICGTTGTFSNGGHVYVTGGTVPTSAAPLTWYLSYVGLYDITECERDLDSALAGLCYDNNLTYINGGKIYTGTVTAAQIAAGAVTADKLSTGAVTTDKLYALAVTAAKIAAGAITADKLSANAVTAGKVAANAITAATIAASAVTTDKLSTGAVTATKIAARTITADRIAAGAITANEIAASTITGAKIAANAITATNIAASTITGSKIAAKTITADKISVTSLEAIVARIGGFNINSVAIYSGTNSKTSTVAGIYLGKDAIRAYTSLNAYTHIEDGKLTCAGANIKGDIYVDEGIKLLFKNCYIGDEYVGTPGVYRRIISQAAGTAWGYAYLSIDFNFYGKDAKLQNLNVESISLGGTPSNGQGVRIGPDKIEINAENQSRASASMTGDGQIICTSIIRSGGEIQTTYINSYRMVQGNYGSFWRNDGSALYLMLTAAGDTYGSYNSLRPFAVSLSSGRVTIGNSLQVDNGLGVAGSVTASGNAMANGSVKGYSGVYWGDSRCVYSSDNTIMSLQARGSYLEISTYNGGYGINWWQSDRKLKKDIRNTDVMATDMINRIQHRAFAWKDESRGSVQVGYVAQELEEAGLDVTYKIRQPDGTELYQIDQTKLLPYITKAIQELAAKVEQQRN